MHPFDLAVPPPGQRLPLLVVVNDRPEVVVLEGVPERRELREILRRLLPAPSLSPR